MVKIVINREVVQISIETYTRLARLARQKKISLAKAVQFCLQKVI